MLYDLTLIIAHFENNVGHLPSVSGQERVELAYLSDFAAKAGSLKISDFLRKLIWHIPSKFYTPAYAGSVPGLGNFGLPHSKSVSKCVIHEK